MDQHEVDVKKIQSWLWHCVKAGWQPSGNPGNPGSHWSHDDNMAAQPFGWMIVRPPKSQFLALMSLVPGRDAQDIFIRIAEMAPIDPLCAKAFAILTAQQLQHPTRTFEYRKEL